MGRGRFRVLGGVRKTGAIWGRKRVDSDSSNLCRMLSALSQSIQLLSSLEI